MKTKCSTPCRILASMRLMPCTSVSLFAAGPNARTEIQKTPMIRAAIDAKIASRSLRSPLTRRMCPSDSTINSWEEAEFGFLVRAHMVISETPGEYRSDLITARPRLPVSPTTRILLAMMQPLGEAECFCEWSVSCKAKPDLSAAWNDVEIRLCFLHMRFIFPKMSSWL